MATAPSTKDAAFCAKWAPIFQARTTWVDCGTYGYTRVDDLRPITEQPTDIRFSPKRAMLQADETRMRSLHADVADLLATAGQDVEAAMKLMTHVQTCFDYGTPPRRVADAVSRALSQRYHGEDAGIGINGFGSTGGDWWTEE